MSFPGRARRATLAVLPLSLLLSPFARAQEEVSLYDYVLSDPAGNEARLAPYRGKILVVEFFATWCPPCRKDLPEVTSLQESYPPDKVVFVAVSADGVSKTVDRLPSFMKETGVKVPVLVGGGILVDRFAGVEEKNGRQITLPQTYIFSGEGEILMRLVGDQKSKKRALAEELDRILKEEVPRKDGP
jgi:thiol-disulfide isomerase/thioredoxin